jgi:hypothetical protein
MITLLLRSRKTTYLGFKHPENNKTTHQELSPLSDVGIIILIITASGVKCPAHSSSVAATIHVMKMHNLYLGLFPSSTNHVRYFISQSLYAS